jgi:DNA-binding NarL/FixJ family response regulator
MTITIILADDHAMVRDGLQVLLESQKDIRVVAVASDGRQAVLKVLALLPDIVIMDIAMPEMNGIEAAAQIQQESPATSVIILSMHTDNEYVYRAFQAGVRGYLLKESAGSEVIKAVRTVSCGRIYLSQKISDKILSIPNLLNRNRSPLDSLSQREREVLQLTVEGKPSHAIAEKLSLSPKTVETYRNRLMQKLNLDSLPALVKFAIQHGLTQLDE